MCAYCPKAYLRECGAARLQVDAGMAPARVARTGLLCLQELAGDR
jgi:hypothetical protein